MNSLGKTRKESGAHPLDRGNTSTLKEYGLKPKDLCMIPARVALALQADGWWLRSDIIWAKPNPMPESVTDRPTTSHEHVFLLAKSKSYYYDADAVREPHLHGGDGLTKHERLSNNPTLANGMSPASISQSGWTAMKGNPAGRNKRTVWTIATAPYSGAHFATFPPKLVEPMILAGTSERGACPECGGPWVRCVETVGYDRQRWAPGEDQYHTQAKGCERPHG